MPILSFSDLQIRCAEENKSIYEVAQEEEASLLGEVVDVVRLKVLEDLLAMKDAVKNGLKSKEKAMSGWCGDDCAKLIEKYQKKGAIFGKTFEKITTYALATAEENLRMGRIVACPTAGSCGIVPSVIIAAAEEEKISETQQINGLLTAGMTGLIISNKVQLAGAVAGCQAECGAAAAILQLLHKCSEAMLVKLLMRLHLHLKISSDLPAILYAGLLKYLVLREMHSLRFML